MEWAVLNWNEPAIKFYRSLGARPQDEWTVYRLQGETLQAVVRMQKRLSSGAALCSSTLTGFPMRHRMVFEGRC